MAAKVTLYTTGRCGYCTGAASLLSSKNVAFQEIRVDARPDLRSWLKERSGQRTIPQLFVNGSALGGYSDLVSLDRQGKLDPLLARDPVSSDPDVRT